MIRRTLLALILGTLIVPAVASARAPASPSGQPMPTWWGEPGGDPGGFWDDSHFVMANGEGCCGPTGTRATDLPPART